MGILRVEPRARVMDPKRYKALHDLLQEAADNADEYHIFYDLDDDENGANTRKDLLHVASQERMSVVVKRLRKSRSLSLEFGDARPTGKERMSAEDYKNKVLDVLKKADGPLKKAEILERADIISASTWHFRITELVQEGLVIRKGTRQAAVYSLS